MLDSLAQSIQHDYEFHTMLIHRFVDGILNYESLLQLPFQHNCMNWILGHIVTNRSHVLSAVNADHAWQEEVRALYHSGTPPVTADSASVPFDRLVAHLDESDGLLQAALLDLTDTRLDEMHTNYRGEKTRYEHLLSFHWHEAFHIGQLEILRAFIVEQR